MIMPGKRLKYKELKYHSGRPGGLKSRKFE